MSLFVGPIHHWLFNKIKTFEEMEEKILIWGKDRELVSYALEESLYEKYGRPVGDQTLEEIIDGENIHGWLQEKISRAEIRQSALITEIINRAPESIVPLENLFREEGIRVGKAFIQEKGETISGAIDLFQGLHDYLLEGMPCDRVTEVLRQEDREVLWKTNQCLHEKYWEAVKSDVQIFYRLRDLWIKGFIEAADSDYAFYREGPLRQKIKRVQD